MYTMNLFEFMLYWLETLVAGFFLVIIPCLVMWYVLHLHDCKKHPDLYTKRIW